MESPTWDVFDILGEDSDDNSIIQTEEFINVNDCTNCIDDANNASHRHQQDTIAHNGNTMMQPISKGDLYRNCYVAGGNQEASISIVSTRLIDEVSEHWCQSFHGVITQ